MHIEGISKLCVLPKTSSPQSRMVTLPHPRTSIPSRYFFDPLQGLYEFTRIAAPKTACRSWFIQGDTTETNKKRKREHEAAKEAPTGGDATRNRNQSAVSQDYILQTADILVATPIDPLFLLIPALVPVSSSVTTAKSPSKNKGLFLSFDDLLDPSCESSRYFAYTVSHDFFRQELESRLEAICDTVDAGDESMYRLNESKLLEELFRKAQRMVETGLPPSMEEHFIKRQLDVPVTSIKNESIESTSAPGTEQIDQESSISQLTAPSLTHSDCTLSNIDSGKSFTSSEDQDSQFSTTSVTSITTAVSSASTTLTIPSSSPLSNESNPPRDSSAIATTPEITQLLRLHTALSYIISSYIPPHVSQTIKVLVSSPHPDSNPKFSTRFTNTQITTTSIPDFTPLHTHLAHLSSLRAAATASRSISDFSLAHSYSQKRPSDIYPVDDEAEKSKRRKVEESRGARELKKVNTKGMQKLSSFFVKKAPAPVSSGVQETGVRRSPRKKV